MSEGLSWEQWIIHTWKTDPRRIADPLEVKRWIDAYWAAQRAKEQLRVRAQPAKRSEPSLPTLLP